MTNEIFKKVLSELDTMEKKTDNKDVLKSIDDIRKLIK